MALSNKFGSLLLTTGNKSELAVGYCTLYGDMNVGLAVIADLPKTMVYRVARWRNRRKPDLPEAYYYRGLARLQQKKNTEAKADFQKALELDPNGPDAKDIRDILKSMP